MDANTLAEYSVISLYSAMAVLTLSMLGFVLYLARAATARDDARSGAGVRAVDRELVEARHGAGGGGAEASVPDATDAVSAVPGVAGERHTGDAGRAARKAAGSARMFAWLATLLLAAAVIMRGASVHRPPLGNLYEFVTAASLVVMLAFCLWGLRRNVDWLGVFVTAPVLLMLGMAVTLWYTEAAQLLPSLRSYWLVIHVTVATISVGVFTLAAMVTVLYLLADRAEAKAAAGTPGTGMGARLMRVLPRARELERLSYALHVIAFPLWTFTLIAGAIWARQAWASYWNWDPKEVWTFIIWVVYAAYLHARATTGISKQRAAYIALAGFGCIIVNYSIVNMYFVGQHSYSGL
ncbi:c-type cytochrome biogenesis protein CcsB [Nostocoides vanveenii]|uniref:C-type cytochrome biogenesis protein CcsB n=1 Tax=Nostocoides vanveenii TaxID=330835 RepID=A0ABN2KAX2_9MICO